VLGPCPVAGCGGSVSDRGKGWICSSRKSREEPGCGFVIWKEQGGKKLSRTACAKILADSPSTPPAARTAAVEFTPCPVPGCGGAILDRAKSWSCNSWKSQTDTGCGFVIWKSKRDGTEVTPETARDRITACDWDKPAVVDIICPCPMPRCKGSIVEKPKSYSCNSWTPSKKGCGLVVWKTDRTGNVIVTREQLPAQLERIVAEDAERKAARKRG
jgi:hypothetical protein